MLTDFGPLLVEAFKKTALMEVFKRAAKTTIAFAGAGSAVALESLSSKVKNMGYPDTAKKIDRIADTFYGVAEAAVGKEAIQAARNTIEGRPDKTGPRATLLAPKPA
jgi:hypothetical protein